LTIIQTTARMKYSKKSMLSPLRGLFVLRRFAYTHPIRFTRTPSRVF
jgi:hypothetical protein